jgi:hypothetical protein
MSVTTLRKCSVWSCGNALDERDDWTRSDGRCATCVEAWDLLLAEVMAAKLRDSVDTGAAGVLTVASRSFGTEASIESVLDGTAVAESVTLTSDGRGALTTAWHEGAENAWVFVERWTAAGRVFHGFVDSVTRKLLQAG